MPQVIVGKRPKQCCRSLIIGRKPQMQINNLIRIQCQPFVIQNSLTKQKNILGFFLLYPSYTLFVIYLFHGNFHQGTLRETAVAAKIFSFISFQPPEMLLDQQALLLLERKIIEFRFRDKPNELKILTYNIGKISMSQGIACQHHRLHRLAPSMLRRKNSLRRYSPMPPLFSGWN